MNKKKNKMYWHNIVSTWWYHLIIQTQSGCSNTVLRVYKLRLYILVLSFNQQAANRMFVYACLYVYMRRLYFYQCIIIVCFFSFYYLTEPFKKNINKAIIQHDLVDALHLVRTIVCFKIALYIDISMTSKIKA